MKLSLSKFIFDNKENIKSYILNKHTIFEGSKIGIFPTSVNTNNYLIQNNPQNTSSLIYANRQMLNRKI